MNVQNHEDLTSNPEYRSLSNNRKPEIDPDEAINANLSKDEFFLSKSLS